MIESNGYYFTNKWFEFAFSNPEKINPSHTAMYLWIVQLNNKMNWAEKFASPAGQTMQAIGLKSYNTYKKVFNELVEFGFIKVITESKNQYTACIIALSNFDEANSKANNLPYQDLIKQIPKQSESTVQSTDSINKHIKPKESKKPIKQLLPQLELNDNDLYKKIIDYFNLKTGQKLSDKTKHTRTLIEARVNDGYTFENFITVIDKKYDEWIGDSKMKQYIHPDTLFSPKFEKYLNQICAVVDITKKLGKSDIAMESGTNYLKDKYGITN